jgi:hypothetical protein
LLGRLYLEASNTTEKENQETEDAFASLGIVLDKALKVERDEEEFFYLWETSFDIYEIFKIVKNYLDENYQPASALLLRLIDGRNLPLEDALKQFHYIRCGYINTIVPSPAN